MRRKKEEERSKTDIGTISSFIAGLDIKDYLQDKTLEPMKYYANFKYSSSMISKAINSCGFSKVDSQMYWKGLERLAFVYSLKEIDYARFKEGYHLVNHLPSRLNLNEPKNFIIFMEDIQISMKLGLAESFEGYEKCFIEGYRLDHVPDLWRFLNTDNSAEWRVVSQSESGKKDVFVKNPIEYKEKLLKMSEFIQNDDSEEEDKGTEDEQANQQSSEVQVDNSPDINQVEETKDCQDDAKDQNSDEHGSSSDDGKSIKISNRKF